MREQNVEKLFRDSFSNFEADVNPSVWANIEQGLPSTPQNIPGSSPVKPSGFLGKISLNTIVLIAAISATLIGTIIYFSSQKPISQNAVDQNVQSPSQQNKVVATLTDAPSIDETPVPAPQKNIADQKQTAPKGQEKTSVNKPVQQTPSQVKTENSNGVSATPNSVTVQVPSTVNPTATEPVAEKENSVASGKVSVSTSLHIQSTQPESPKVYTAPNNETSTGTEEILNNAVSSETINSSESGEEFHFFIPNVFTPDGNQVNDVFQPMANNSLIKDYEMVIYDRYGFEIFRSLDFALPWDGRLRDGNMAAEAVYVYTIKLIDFKGESQHYIGHVALLR